MSKKVNKLGYIIIGLFLIAVGICFVAFNNSLTVLAISIGSILAASATFFGVVTIAKKDRGVRFALKIAFAIICLIAGITTAIFNEKTVGIMISVFSLLLIVDGSFKLNTAVMSKRYSVGGWWVMLITSVLIILSAFVLAKNTPSENSAATVWLGITVIVDGLSNIFSAIWTSLYEKAEYKEICGEILVKDEATAEGADVIESIANSENNISKATETISCEEEA